MTIDFICEELAELFDSPCNYSPIDEAMFQDKYCESHCGKITDKECWKQYFEKMWADRKDEPSNSEKPNNCEHITEDGVTCAKYPACDDCPDNPLNKVKGSERLVKGSEIPNNSTISKMEQVDKDINVRSKDEQTDCTEALTLLWIKNMVTDEEFYRIDARLKVMTQTERSE